MLQERSIPAYSLFGQTAGLVEPRFCHVERIGDRWKLHSGQVEEHSHPHLHQVTLWISGRGSYVADELATWIAAGSCCWMPAGVVHGFSVEAGSEAIVLSISDDFAREQLAGLARFNLFRKCLLPRFEGPEAEWMRALFSRVEREYASAGPGHVEYIGSLARLVLTEVLRKSDADAVGGHRGGESSLLVRFMSLVESRLGERPNIDALASELGSTPYLLNRACRKGLGLRASEVVRARHVQEAKRLLLFTALGIGEVGELLGYPDPAHFARSFRSAVGQSPSEWREARIGMAAGSSAADGRE